jgi:hypothetical protein
MIKANIRVELRSIGMSYECFQRAYRCLVSATLVMMPGNKRAYDKPEEIPPL